jgi:hypothetical protein
MRVVRVSFENSLKVERFRALTSALPLAGGTSNLIEEVIFKLRVGTR